MARAPDRCGLVPAALPAMLTGMRHRGVLRLCALFLALALGLGLALYGVQAGEMAAKMVAAAGADMPASSDGCDGDASGGACAAVCLGPVAVLPVDSVAIPPSVVRHAVSADALGAGRLGPPEPFPPKLPTLA